MQEIEAKNLTREALKKEVWYGSDDECSVTLYRPKEDYIKRMMADFDSYCEKQNQKNKEENLPEQVTVVCIWLFDGDYIHVLNNRADTTREIKRLVKHYNGTSATK